MTKIKDLGMGALIGSLLTIPQIALMYLMNQLVGLPFVPFDFFEWLTPLLPGPMITFGIDRMLDLLLFFGLDVADTAKTAEQIMAVLVYFAIGILTGVLFYLILKNRSIKAGWMTGLVIGALYGLPFITVSMGKSSTGLYTLVSLIWLLSMYLGWGLLFGLSYRRMGLEPPPSIVVDEVEPPASVKVVSRRQFLITLGASAAAVTVVGAGLGELLRRSEERGLLDGLASSLAHQVNEDGRLNFPNANDPVVPVPGTRPEYTPIKDHYKVFIALDPTEIDAATWRLPVTGLVDNPLMLSLDELRDNFPARNQYVTLSCISGRVGTTLISTTQWTGVSVQDVLAKARVRPEALYLHIRSGDGFYETVSLDLINADKRIMFCYGWDGNLLPVDHGFPLRIWIPDRFGMKQPKWITSVEVTDKYTPGYWVERSWDEVAKVKATSVIDTVAVNALVQDGDQVRVPVGGIAWSGDHGISKVEVRVDDGAWQPAQLRAPLSETTWVVWRFEWPFEAGPHTFEVRCADASGTPQVETAQPAHPDGATGIHQVEAEL